MKARTIYAIVALPLLAGCFNLATRPEQITGSYSSPLKYTSYECKALAVESASLARRENQLRTAQEHRRKSDKVQAFWLGFGTGDGIEASELANVRGDSEAVRQAMSLKGCRPEDPVSVGATPDATPSPRPPSDAQGCVSCQRIIDNGSKP